MRTWEFTAIIVVYSPYDIFDDMTVICHTVGDETGDRFGCHFSLW